MASISSAPNGRRVIQFSLGGGRRQSIRLGKMPMKAAETVKVRVEHLVVAKMTGSAVEPETARWLTGLDDALHEKLAKVDLVVPRKKSTLAEFVTGYVASRTNVKPATKEIWRQGERGLVNNMGGDRPLGSITPGDADRYKFAMIAQKLASFTILKRLQFARMIFRAAIRDRLITENPFAEVSIKAGMEDRRRFIGHDQIDRILAVCPPDWRTIIALARYGGLRCPSEVLSLRWIDIHWDTERITVRSPKTEHHIGKASREIPLFPELKPILAEAQELAERGAEYVVGGNYRDACQSPIGWRNINLRTQFLRILNRAGIDPWPRLFHNLRSSRQTELADRFPTHIVCRWLGNSEDVAKEHYLQTTDEHFARAASGALQNPVQHAPAMTCNDRNLEAAPLAIASFCGVLQNFAINDVDEAGFEPA